MHMEEFLAKEAVTGRLKTGLLPPHNSSEAWGAGLWHYMKKVSAYVRGLSILIVVWPTENVMGGCGCDVSAIGTEYRSLSTL